MVERLRVRDVQVAYRIDGVGPPLLLMHGAEGDHRMFDGITALLARHLTVIRYDQRDCGETENPPQPCGLIDLAHDARGLLLALGIPRAHVCGTSFGGRVAQVLALTHPDVVNRLVLGSTWPVPQSIAELNPSGVAAIQELRARLPQSAEELAEYFFPQPYLNEQPQWRALFQNAQPNSERGRRRALAVSDNTTLEVASISRPTHLIANSLDRIVPPAVMRRMAGDIAGATFSELSGVGHAGVLQAPDRVAASILAFLR
jgi:pimeloyl-ACP methyl ester carboxylesterase